MSTVAGRMEYIVDFNDSAMVAGIPRTHAAFKNLATQATTSHAAVGTAANQSSNTVVSATNKATRAIEDHGKKTKSVLEMVEWRLKYTGISAVTYAGMAGIGAFTAALVAASSAGIQFNSMMEKSTIAYTTMLGSAGEASNMLGKLYDLAAKSPFTFEDFVTGTQRLIAYGVAGKDVLRTLQAIGDATAAVGGTTDVFTRMSFSIGQMVSQGKITAREMRELAMAGVPAWQVLADAIGKTVAETQKLSETVGIAAEVGIPALLSGIEERFGGMQEKMNQTWTALGSTFKDYMSQMAGYAEGGFFETLKKQLNDINNWIGEINDRARQVGFMNALKEQAPGAYDALKVLEVNLRAVGDAFGFVGDVVKPFVQIIDPLFVQFAVGALVIPKIIPALTAMTRSLVGLTIISRVKTLFQDFTAILHNVRVGAWSASGGLSMAYDSTKKALGAFGMVGIVAAAAGVGYTIYKKHLDEVNAAQKAAVEGAQTLVASLGGSWNEVAKSADEAAASTMEFSKANAVVLEQLGKMSSDARQAYLLSFAVEMQMRDMPKAEVQRQLDELVDAAGLSLQVPVGIDAESSASLMNEYMAAIADQLEQSANIAWGESLGEGLKSVFTLGIKRSMDINTFAPVLDGTAKVLVDSWAQALYDQAAQGDWAGVFEAFVSQSESEAVLTELLQKFGELGKVVSLAETQYRDLDEAMKAMAGDFTLPAAARAMALAWEYARMAGESEDESLQAMRNTFEYLTAAMQDATAAADQFAVSEEAVKAATEAWQKELEAQYSIGDAYNKALQERQEALNDAATAQNEANQRAAEAEKKTIDARANAEIKSIERVRDIRLASLKEQEELYNEQKSFAESIGFGLGVQMAEDHIKALENEQEAVKAAADAEKDAIKARADAQKEAVEAVKVSAEKAELTINDISAALEEAIEKSDDYLANMAFLPERVQTAIMESGLTPEQKRQLAEELVAGSAEDRERAFEILQKMADRRSKEAAEQWGRYSATVSELSAAAGQDIVDALVGKLAAGGGKVYAAVGDYSESVARALNPILEALGAKQIQVVGSTMVGVGAGVKAGLLAYAMGGMYLPSQATIQQPVGARGLVQWAEPSTKGEAFIPLAPEKRPRSLAIWEQTGRMLGAFALGGILSPWEGMESPSGGPTGLIPPTLLPVFGQKNISMPYSGNVGMQGTYDLASAWMKSPGAAGVVTPSATGFAGMVATAVAVWNAVKAFDGGVDFMGGRAYRPYKSDHTTGHAFDFGGSSSQMAAAAAWLAMMNPNEDVKYIIHNPLGIWKPSTGWRPYTPAKSVLKYAGESAWHRDHVHVSTYDQGGLLMPGVTLAYNGTGRPERVMADGGITAPDSYFGYSSFTGGASTYTYTPAQEQAAKAAEAAYKRAAAAAGLYAAQLEKLTVQGYSAEDQIRKLNDQIDAVQAQRNAANAFRMLMIEAGATSEQMAELQTNVVELDVTLAGLRQKADDLARVNLESTLSRWAAAASQFSAMMDLAGEASDWLTRQGAILPNLMGSIGAQFTSNLDLMDQATSADQVMQYANAAISNVSSMFSAEKNIIDRQLSDTLAAIGESQQLIEDAYRDRSDALSEAFDNENQALSDRQDDLADALSDEYDRAREALDEQKDRLSKQFDTNRESILDALDQERDDLQDAQKAALKALDDYYTSQIEAIQGGQQAVDRQRVRNKSTRTVGEYEDELRILMGQEGHTSGDIARINELKTLIQDAHDEMREQEEDWTREDQIDRLQEQKEAAAEQLRAQQEAELEALNDRIEAMRKQFDAEKDAYSNSIAAQRKALQKQYEAQREAQQEQFEQERRAQQESQKQREQALQAQYEAQIRAIQQEQAAARAAAQAEIDNLVVKYQQMMQTVIDNQNRLLDQQFNYQNAGYTLGTSFAQGLLEALPIIALAAQQAAQTAADYLQLHSPAKTGPLSTVDKWLSPLPGMLVKPLRWDAVADASSYTAANIRNTSAPGGWNGRLDILLRSDGSVQQNIDTRQLARELAPLLEEIATVRAYDF